MTEEEISKRFTGVRGVVSVRKVDINPKKFAHVELEVTEEEERVLEALRSIYKSAKWKGGKLEFEKAQPNFLQRLKAEQTPTDTMTSHAKVRISNGPCLHFRRPKGLASIARKKPRIVDFEDEDENASLDKPLVHEQVDDVLVADCKTGVPNTAMNASQDLAYCCTQGDAGISGQSEEDDQTTALCLVVRELVSKQSSSHSTTPNLPGSLLGRWYADKSV